MHFWVLAARLYGSVPVPRNTSLNWFIPALVNSSVGSSCGTTGELGTKVWPCFCTKKSRNCWRISREVIGGRIVEGTSTKCKSEGWSTKDTKNTKNRKRISSYL